MGADRRRSAVGRDAGRVAAWLALGAIALGALAALAIVAAGGTGEFSDRDWRVVGTLLAALFCGSAALVALRFRMPYRVVAAIPVVALLWLGVAIWDEDIWRGQTETLAKFVLTALALTLSTLLVGSLRLQAGFADRRATFVYLGVSALIVATTLFALFLLWSWDAPFVDGGGGGRENVANVAQRLLLALFSLSVAAYLATPLVTRMLLRGRERSPR